MMLAGLRSRWIRFAVRLLNGLRDLAGDAQSLGNRNRARLDAGLESLAAHVLHHDENGARIFPNLEHFANEWMIQGGGSERFPAKTLPRDAVASQVCRQELQCDATIELRIVGEEDFAHSTRTDAVD
jgi:hypothetical protein